MIHKYAQITIPFQQINVTPQKFASSFQAHIFDAVCRPIIAYHLPCRRSQENWYEHGIRKQIFIYKNLPLNYS